MSIKSRDDHGLLFQKFPSSGRSLKRYVNADGGQTDSQCVIATRRPDGSYELNIIISNLL